MRQDQLHQTLVALLGIGAVVWSVVAVWVGTKPALRPPRLAEFLAEPEKAAKWMLVFAALVAGIGFWFVNAAQINIGLFDYFLNDFYANIATEVFGIAITVLVIDNLYRRRQKREEIRRTCDQMRSPDPQFASEAVWLALHEGWFHDGSLVGMNLSYVDLERAPLARARLDRTDLEGTNLKLAILTRADLSKSNLNFVELNGARLRGTNLAGANLLGASLGGADLRGAILETANLDNVLYDRLTIFDSSTKWPRGYPVPGDLTNFDELDEEEYEVYEYESSEYRHLISNALGDTREKSHDSYAEWRGVYGK